MKKFACLIALTVAIFACSTAHAAVRISPLTTFPSPAEPNGTYGAIEYVSMDKIGDALPGGSHVSISGENLTVGYKFDKGRIEYTALSYKAGDAPAGLLQRDSMTSGVLQASVRIPSKGKIGKWAGDIGVGVRWFSNSVGKQGELYVMREFNADDLSFTAGVNIMEQDTRSHDTLGFFASGNYSLSPIFRVTGTYASTDFYKGILNDYVTPYFHATNPNKLGCTLCSSYAASGGLTIDILKGKGIVYLLYYSGGENSTFSPLLGLTMKF